MPFCWFCHVVAQFVSGVRVVFYFCGIILVIPTQPPTTEDLPVVSGSVGGAAALLLIVGAVVLCVWRKK